MKQLTPLHQGSSIGAAFLAKYLKGVVEIREYKTTEQHDLDLKTPFNDAIAAAKTDGTITKVSQNWFGFHVTPR